jgi:hypothetical protein
MGLTGILAEIDQEIARLTQARGLLSDGTVVKHWPGRPKPLTAVVKAAKKKRNLTPEGRKRIQEAVIRRWAAHRKAA